MKNLKFKVISKYLSPYKKEFLFGALALLLVNILSVVIPLEVKNIIDQLQNGFSSDFVISKSLWLILLATSMGLIRLFSRQIVFGIGRKVEVNLRQKLFDHLLIQDPEWIQKKGSGDIISRATSDVENIRRLLGFTVLSLCNIVLAYSFTIPSMFSINKTLTISALMIFPLILGIVSLFGGRMVKQRKVQQESLSKLSDLIQEDLSGISAIKIYAQENAETKEFNIHNKAYRDSAIKLARTASTLFPLLQGISSISLLILLSLGTYLTYETKNLLKGKEKDWRIIKSGEDEWKSVHSLHIRSISYFSRLYNAHDDQTWFISETIVGVPTQLSSHHCSSVC